MKGVYIKASHIISALGYSTAENFQQLLLNQSGIHLNEKYSPGMAVPLALINQNSLPFEIDPKYTYLENLMIFSISQSLSEQSFDYTSPSTLLIISTTKGNIDLLDKRSGNAIPKERAELSEMAVLIQEYFKLINTPLIVSNACISGVMAVIMAQRMISTGSYDHVIVCGADIASEFVLSGFNCLKAISHNNCRPFDKERNGINLGEAVACVVLSKEKSNQDEVHFEVLGGAVTNDANHISGPSRTGEGLSIAIQKTLQLAKIKAEDIDSISAHGTATIYNDEMESMAMFRCGLDEIPVNSYKGYIGHTLGAAGVIEIAMSIESMRQNILIKSLGYEQNGVEHLLNVIQKNESKKIDNLLKLSSGFGGCNAALIIQKQ